MKFLFSIFSLFILFSTSITLGDESNQQKNFQSFYVEGLDIEVSQKEMGSNGPYPINGVSLVVKRGENVVLDETREISGELKGAWVTDLDRDTNPEVIIWVRGHGSGGYGEFKLIEINGKKLYIVQFPPLKEPEREGYAGHDQLTTSPTNIIRKFQKYQSGDPNCCPTGATFEITYGFRDGKVLIERTRELK